MTKQDIEAWLSTLTDDSGNRCKTSTDKIEVVKELLNHASEDGMTPEDKAVCTEVLEQLTTVVH